MPDGARGSCTKMSRHKQLLMRSETAHPTNAPTQSARARAAMRSVVLSNAAAMSARLRHQVTGTGFGAQRGALQALAARVGAAATLAVAR